MGEVTTRLTEALRRRRGLVALGQRAIDYYIDTGLCVFCGADDVYGRPHEDHCNVGDIAGVKVDARRIAEKQYQREIVDNYTRTPFDDR